METKLIGSPLNLSRKEIIRVAIFLQLPVDAVEAVMKRNCRVINSSEFGLMQYRSDKINYNGCTYSINENIVFIKFGAAAHTSLVFACLVVMKLGFHNSIMQYYNNYCDNIKRITEDTSEIQMIMRNVSSRYNSLSVYNPPDYALFIRTLKKHKCKVEESVNDITIHFKNIKLGNDIEGYISYKEITVVWKKYTDNIKPLLCRFNKFYLSTAWEHVETPLHPHISTDGSICYGNRSDDYILYRNHGRWEFVADLLYETVHSYSPENPFASVRAIAGFIQKLERVINADKTIKFLSDAESSEEWLNNIMSTSNRCSRCGSPLVNSHCTGSSCVRNPEAIINCTRCHTQLVWNADSGQFYCANTNCSNSPNFIVSCDHCLSEMRQINIPNHGTVHSCNTPNCAGNMNVDGYTIEREEVTTPPACRICGREMRQNTTEERSSNIYDLHSRLYYHNWYCGRCTGTPQYDAYGTPLHLRQIPMPSTQPNPDVAEPTATSTSTTSTITLDSGLVAISSAPIQREYRCISCNELLAENPITHIYYCGNGECGWYGTAQRDYDGDLTLTVDCDECGGSCEHSDPHGAFICVNDECGNYGEAQYNNNGDFIL